MKKGIHPEYRDVLFHDISADIKFVTRSTMKADATIEHEGNTYPYVKLDISSASHPFYTGKQQVVQAEGRIANFNRRFGQLSKKKS